jgi:hypothetical protein
MILQQKNWNSLLNNVGKIIDDNKYFYLYFNQVCPNIQKCESEKS